MRPLWHWEIIDQKCALEKGHAEVIDAKDAKDYFLVKR
jgi:hypothetical protein